MTVLLKLGVEEAASVTSDDAFKQVGCGNGGCTTCRKEFTFLLDTQCYGKTHLTPWRRRKHPQYPWKGRLPRRERRNQFAIGLPSLGRRAKERPGEPHLPSDSVLRIRNAQRGSWLVLIYGLCKGRLRRRQREGGRWGKKALLDAIEVRDWLSAISCRVLATHPKWNRS
jgi:hypothetical protein